jgi:hypothetical protein
LIRLSPPLTFGLAAVCLSAAAWAAPPNSKEKKSPVVVRLGPVKRIELNYFTINGIYGTGMIFPPGEEPYLALATDKNGIEKTPLSQVKKLEFDLVGEDAKGPAPRPCPLYKVTATLGSGKSAKAVTGILDMGNAWGNPVKGAGEWRIEFCGDKSAWRELRSVEINEPITALPKSKSKK